MKTKQSGDIELYVIQVKYPEDTFLAKKYGTDWINLPRGPKAIKKRKRDAKSSLTICRKDYGHYNGKPIEYRMAKMIGYWEPIEE